MKRLFQLLVKLGKTEDLLEHYELLEEVYKAGEKEGSKTGSTTRVLGMNDRVLQTQNKWKGRGKFLLQQCKVILIRIRLFYHTALLICIHAIV